MKRSTGEPRLFEDPKPKTPPITEGMVRKGGRNQGASQVKERPAAPAPIKRRQEVVVHRQQAPTPPSNFLAVIMTAATNPACDVDKMRALLEMQERIEDRDARKAFTIAFNALQAELPVINKDGLIDHGEGTTARGNKKLKARWATYPNIMSVCGPLLKRYGFTLSSVIEPATDGTRINVVGYLDHIGGHSRVSRFPLSRDETGGKNNQQGWGSSQQYGMRYNAIALLNIVSEAKIDNDNDGFKKSADADDSISTGTAGNPTLITEEQAVQVRDAIEGCGVPLKTFTDKFRVKAVADLPASEFRNALASCANYKKAKDGQK